MCSLYQLVQTVLGLFWWCIIIYIVLSWLVALNVVNTYNPIVNTIGGFLHKIIEPVLKPIRRIVPIFSGIDLAPLILLLLLWFVRSLLAEYWGVQACARAATGS